MDLKQRKLYKSEWESIEVPVSSTELDVLNLIKLGYNNVNYKNNINNSLSSFLKIENNEKMEDYLFVKYFQSTVNNIEKHLLQYNKNYIANKVNCKIQIKSADKIRLDKNEDIKNIIVYENILLNHMDKIVQYKIKDTNKKKFNFNYFTLYKLNKNTILNLNRHIKDLANKVIDLFADEISISNIIKNSVDFIERNENLLKFSDMELYDHQKEIYTIFKGNRNTPKFALYMAPTGTGKTLTPIGLSEEYKIIFVCAARHVGIALARAAISANKKVAFAFGCASADDIRLHYSSAKEYTRNRKSGGIGKVDNSVGDNVEIMISDIKSYTSAMYYMKSFNKIENLILYWDEPTITMDYENHEFHGIIKNNWKENIIPNVILSSATLPKVNDLETTIPDFKEKFKNAEIYNIISDDCKKSIPIVNNDGFVVLPHYLCDDYQEILKIIEHCENYLTLLRYFDLGEVVKFIEYIIDNKYTNSKMNLERHFDTLDYINMKNVKMYYLKLLKNIIPDKWKEIYEYFNNSKNRKIPTNDTVDLKGNKNITKIVSPVGSAGVYVTTKDAHTLKDGPTIFISDDIEKIARFCIQQANIPSVVMDDLMKKIEYNNTLNIKIEELEKEIEFIKEKNEKNITAGVSCNHGGSKVSARSKSTKDIKMFDRDTEEGDSHELKKMTADVTAYRAMIKPAMLNDTFVPNKHHHVQKWAEGFQTNNTFTCDIQENIVNEIMLLAGIENSWKILLMMGIGVFINHENIRYTEIMKQLADQQKLFMIIASSDYIYGTNYQFCHGYISKDLQLTQEKLIQAMGRVGRNNVQQTYTIRFRDNEQIIKLFTAEAEKPEVINMNKLFSSL
jgi:hypothetical protein